jgi:hypothetical protein
LPRYVHFDLSSKIKSNLKINFLMESSGSTDPDSDPEHSLYKTQNCLKAAHNENREVTGRWQMLSIGLGNQGLFIV